MVSIRDLFQCIEIHDIHDILFSYFSSLLVIVKGGRGPTIINSISLYLTDSVEVVQEKL